MDLPSIRISKSLSSHYMQEIIREIRKECPADSPEFANPLLEKAVGAIISPSEPSYQQPFSEFRSQKPDFLTAKLSDINTEKIRNLGLETLSSDGIGILVPMAGSGGRFGGYDKSENSPDRVKALKPLFDIGKQKKVCALDIRVELIERLGAKAKYFFSCNNNTEMLLRDWLTSYPNINVCVARVPENPRFVRSSKMPQIISDIKDAMVRAADGRLLTKPIGSIGLLVAAKRSGVLDEWIQSGIKYAVVANADDVGFRVDTAALGFLEENKEYDAAVLCMPLIAGSSAKGGYIRIGSRAGDASYYVEENANPIGSVNYLSTNQIYFRVKSLNDTILSNSVYDLPHYFEKKKTVVDNGESVDSIHAYRPICEILRIMNTAAIEMQVAPANPGATGYCPLKEQNDVSKAQKYIDKYLKI